MKKSIVVICLVILIIINWSFTNESLRKKYERPANEWPTPAVNDGVAWKELGALPLSPLKSSDDSLNHLVNLGKHLFFDTRLSGSGKISCATCHQPQLHWTDGIEKSLGHEGTVNKRNSPTIQNAWFYDRLFWDGRSRDLQDQAFGPINSESEMHSDMHDVMRKLRASNGYQQLFEKAYGSKEIDPDKMTRAIASFEKTVVSIPSRFDEFVNGNYKVLSDSELRGLHLFRTKAKCMNCHNGAMFTDNQFHNIGFSGEDKGYYTVTHKEEDLGKFKTPSLRDVAYTGPWMHDGQEKKLQDIIHRLNVGYIENKLTPALHLTKREQKDLLAFLQSISQAEFYQVEAPAQID